MQVYFRKKTKNWALVQDAALVGNWALVQNAALVGVEVKLGLVR